MHIVEQALNTKLTMFNERERLTYCRCIMIQKDTHVQRDTRRTSCINKSNRTTQTF